MKGSVSATNMKGSSQSRHDTTNIHKLYFQRGRSCGGGDATKATPEEVEEVEEEINVMKLTGNWAKGLFLPSLFPLGFEPTNK